MANLTKFILRDFGVSYMETFLLCSRVLILYSSRALVNVEVWIISLQGLIDVMLLWASEKNIVESFHITFVILWKQFE